MFRRIGDSCVIKSVAAQKSSSRLIPRIVIALLLSYTAFFVERRTPPHTAQLFFCDFANFYSGSRVWLGGGDPYQMNQVYRAWHASGHGQWLTIPDLEAQDIWAAVYPPPTLVVLAPVAALSAVPAHILWLVTNLAAFIGACAALFSMGRIKKWEQRFLIGLLVFASSAGISTFDSGQLAMVAGCLVIMGIWALRNSRMILAGLLIGLAACFKIQVGIPIILYLALVRRWKSVALAASVFVLATLTGVIPLEISGINWLTELSQNASLTLGASGVNDPMPGGFYRNDMVNLQTILYAFVHSPHIVDAVSFGLVMIAVAWLAMLVISAPRADRNLPLLCLTITLSVLPVYHRLYDVLPLALLLIWSIRRLHTRLRPHAITTLVLLCEFLIPIDFIPTMVRWLHLPQGMTETVWWQGIIVPHHAWGMVLLTGWLLYLCTALAPRAQSAALQSHRREWHGWARLSHR